MHELTVKAKKELRFLGEGYEGNSYAAVRTFCFSMSLLKARNNEVPSAAVCRVAEPGRVSAAASRADEVESR